MAKPMSAEQSAQVRLATLGGQPRPDEEPGQKQGRPLADQKSLDARMHDRAALAEIELYGELVIAASASDGPLSLDDIDAILGIRH